MDSKRNIDSKQDNSNKDNDDSEHNKEIEKDLDDQKEKADNQDSKDEVKSQDLKSILLPLFIVLGLAVVVGIIVYFVCKSKRKNISLQHNTFTNEKSNNETESSFVSEPKLEPEVEKKVKELYERLKIIKVDVSSVWTLEKLKRIFEYSSDSILETLLRKGDDELKTLWFCDKNAKNKVNMKILFNKIFESVFKKFFEGNLKSEKKELFSLLINTGNDNLEKLLNLFYALNKNGFDKIDLTTEIAKILLKNKKFTTCLAFEKGSSGRIINFTAAILTGNYKEGQKSFKVNIENFEIINGDECINFSYTFGNSPVDNLEALLSEFKILFEKYSNKNKFVGFRFLSKIAREYNEWKPGQEQQEYLNESNVENI